MIVIKKLVKAIFIVCLLVGCGVKTYASELNFSVSPEIPENQQDKNKSYYDLKLEPGNKQELKVVLKNGTDKEVEIETSVSRATTNLKGVVEYGKTKDKKDESLVYNIEDFVEIPENNVKIPPNESKELTIKVEAPEKTFEGIMAGGLTFKEVTKEEKVDEKNTGLAIKNEYAYVVGLVLHGENEDMPSEVNLIHVEAAQVNARNVINGTLQNPKAKYLNQVAVNATVTKEGSKEVLYETKQDTMQMAPNSNFQFPISLDGEPLKPGKYTLNMDVSSLTDSWKLTKNFTIEKEVADKFNAKDVSIQEDHTMTYLSIGLGTLLIIGVIIYFIYRHKKKERMRKERLRRERIRRKNKARKREKQKNNLKKS
ncbi:C-terminal membrane anchored cell surface protein [Carnobacterium maltaromaticum]|uniref:DUF916 and DUF3324 domain-containing protein n=1 Tax=Carnobacterium maltaromaticum TaxID=2751 RepID=UPI00191B9793|nr:DUF916 and DUF3324 domain-containing protein [Carnobacterium maltaromaticum]CAD5896742.1 C-terminal membrane anchored cell surface protein [Carnobacterium maltaromaticum]